MEHSGCSSKPAALKWFGRSEAGALSALTGAFLVDQSLQARGTHDSPNFRVWLMVRVPHWRSICWVEQSQWVQGQHMPVATYNIVVLAMSRWIREGAILVREEGTHHEIYSDASVGDVHRPKSVYGIPIQPGVRDSEHLAGCSNLGLIDQVSLADFIVQGAVAQTQEWVRHGPVDPHRPKSVICVTARTDQFNPMTAGWQWVITNNSFVRRAVKPRIRPVSQVGF